MEAINLAPEQINQLVDIGLTVIAILFPGLALYAAAAKRAKDEAIEVLDLLPVSNQSIKEDAIRAGKNTVANNLTKLEVRRAVRAFEWSE